MTPDLRWPAPGDGREYIRYREERIYGSMGMWPDDVYLGSVIWPFDADG